MVDISLHLLETLALKGIYDYWTSFQGLKQMEDLGVEVMFLEESRAYPGKRPHHEGD